MLYSLLRPLLFRFPAEFIHNVTLNLAAQFPQTLSLGFHSPKNQLIPWFYRNQRLNPLRLPNPIILAAGLDKNAMALPFWDKLGLGAVEVGTVTPMAQPGNPGMRIFRIKDESLLNAMGFPNLGMQQVKENILRFRSAYPASFMKIGVNIGKNKTTPLDQAISDYVKGYAYLADCADYMVINISSPNTPGLRSLSTPEWLSECLKDLSEVRKKIPKPLFIKLSPDVDHPKDYEFIFSLLKNFQLSGIVATNTSTQHPFAFGGISGSGVYDRSEQIRRYFLAQMPQEFPDGIMMGVGGFNDVTEAKTFWQQGGIYLQIYSALIYQGPGIIGKFLQSFSSQHPKIG